MRALARRYYHPLSARTCLLTISRYLAVISRASFNMNARKCRLRPRHPQPQSGGWLGRRLSWAAFVKASESSAGSAEQTFWDASACVCPFTMAEYFNAQIYSHNTCACCERVSVVFDRPYVCGAHEAIHIMWVHTHTNTGRNPARWTRRMKARAWRVSRLLFPLDIHTYNDDLCMCGERTSRRVDGHSTYSISYIFCVCVCAGLRSFWTR